MYTVHRMLCPCMVICRYVCKYTSGVGAVRCAQTLPVTPLSS